jgi:DNA-binding beta-propeller fold protein YncE
MTAAQQCDFLNEGGQPNDFAVSPDGRTIYIADSAVFTNATTLTNVLTISPQESRRLCSVRQ